MISPGIKQKLIAVAIDHIPDSEPIQVACEQVQPLYYPYRQPVRQNAILNHDRPPDFQ